MPNITMLSTRHVREVSFDVFAWTVTYREKPVTDTAYTDPSLTIDLFGRIADSASKGVADAIGTYELRHK
ncbi:MAG: hypothetical protein ABIT76_06690 [Chthoniobacterales bacterium]